MIDARICVGIDANGAGVMAALDLDFAETCLGATSVAEVGLLFRRQMEKLGFLYVACCSHVDPLAPPPGAVMILHYPRHWVEHFSANDYARIDPIFLTARRQALPFRWKDPAFRATLSPENMRVLDEAAEAGLDDGFTIPIHAPDALAASCSLAIGPDGVDPLNVRQAHWHAVHAHETARKLASAGLADRKVVRLSKRERECLALAGRGKDDYAIGVILGISQSTAHNTVQRAMAKYGVATRIQAVVRAMRTGEISLEDIAS